MKHSVIISAVILFLITASNTHAQVPALGDCLIEATVRGTKTRAIQVPDYNKKLHWYTEVLLTPNKKIERFTKGSGSCNNVTPKQRYLLGSASEKLSLKKGASITAIVSTLQLGQYIDHGIVKKDVLVAGKSTIPAGATRVFFLEDPQVTNCVNKKYGYFLTNPTGWKVFTRGPGEARPATCSENLAVYMFAKNFFGTSFKNQINLTVSTRGNQVKEFWKGISSLNDYVKRQSSWQVIKEATLDGERLVWLRYNKELKVAAYHRSALYEFDVYSVDEPTMDRFLASFKFSK